MKLSISAYMRMQIKYISISFFLGLIGLVVEADLGYVIAHPNHPLGLTTWAMLPQSIT
jgi:sorbitol-specific phosphotransferase system component IIBC